MEQRAEGKQHTEALSWQKAEGWINSGANGVTALLGKRDK